MDIVTQKLEEFKKLSFDEYIALKGSKRRKITEGIKGIARNPLYKPEIRYEAYELLLETKQMLYEMIEKEKNEFESVCCQIRNLVKNRMNISDDVIDLNIKIKRLEAEIVSKNKTIEAIVKKNKKKNVDELLAEVGELINV